MKNSDGSFSMPSQSVEEIVYTVKLLNDTCKCNWRDFTYNHVEICKHIHAVKFWIASQTFIEEKKPKPKVFSDDSIQCAKCGSIRVVKYGFEA